MDFKSITLIKKNVDFRFLIFFNSVLDSEWSEWCVSNLYLIFFFGKLPLNSKNDLSKVEYINHLRLIHRDITRNFWSTLSIGKNVITHIFVKMWKSNQWGYTEYAWKQKFVFFFILVTREWSGMDNAQVSKVIFFVERNGFRIFCRHLKLYDMVYVLIQFWTRLLAVVSTLTRFESQIFAGIVDEYRQFSNDFRR